MAEIHFDPSGTNSKQSQARPQGRLPGYPIPNRIFFLTFLAFVVFRYVDGGHRMDLLATIRLEFLLGGAAIVMGILKISGQPLQIGSSRKIIIFIALLFVTMIVQLPLAGDPVVAQRVFVDRVFKFAFLTFLTAAFVESPGTLKVFIGAFLFSIYYITLESTQGLITGGLVWQNQGIMRLHGAVPLYGHPNSLGGVAMGTLPFVIFLFRPVRHWLLRLGLLATSVTSIICVVFSGSRTAYIGFFSLLFWWFFQSQKKGKFLVWGLVLAVAILPVIPKQYVGRFKSIGGHEAEGNSQGARKLILEDAIVIFMENPLGIGVASFPAVRMARFGRFQDTHNLYLEVATNLGIQGFVVFIGLIWFLMGSFRQSARSFRSQRERLIRLARTKSLPPGAMKSLRKHVQDLDFCYASAQATAGFILIRLVLGLFGMDLYEIYWWFAAGLAITLSGLVVTTGRRTHFYEQYAAMNKLETPV